MSRLQELIDELCPNGVEYKELEQIADIGTGSHNTNEGSDEGEYPFYVRSQEPLRLDTYDYDEIAIITAGDGVGVGKVFHYVEGKYALHQRAYRIHINTDSVHTKFFFHYMKATFLDYIEKNMFKGSVASIRRPMLNAYKVPVPPLEVQCEIVRVLDSFTLLTDELTDELTARKKQYEYYHNHLMDFRNKDVAYKSVGELFEIKNGLNKEKDAFGKGSPIINFTDVYNKRWLAEGMFKGLVEVSEEEIDRYSAIKGDVFFTRTSETKEDIGMSCALIEDIPNCVFSGFVLRARPITNLLLPKFCAYYFSTDEVRKTIVRYAAFTTRATTTGPKLSKIMVPIISIEEQQRIVDVLDKFGALCNDISTGIPAEIEARKKQYEYYRDKLFSFRELVND